VKLGVTATYGRDAEDAVYAPGNIDVEMLRCTAFGDVDDVVPSPYVHRSGDDANFFTGFHDGDTRHARHVSISSVNVVSSKSIIPST
jgi:hypothetical protein